MTKRYLQLIKNEIESRTRRYRKWETKKEMKYSLFSPTAEKDNKGNVIYKKDPHYIVTKHWISPKKKWWKYMAFKIKKKKDAEAVLSAI